MRFVESAEPAHVGYILDHLSAQNAAERDVLRLSNGELFARIVAMLDKGYSETILGDDGTPIVAFGVAGGFTWFLSTEGAWQHGVRGFRLARERLARARERHGEPLTCISYSPHPDAPKWFRLLGFSESPMSVDGRMVFVYP